MSRNKYKNNEPLNRKAVPKDPPEPSVKTEEELLPPGPLEEPPPVPGVDPEDDPRQAELETRMPEEAPEPVEEYFDREAEKPRIQPARADVLAPPDYREHHLHLESENPDPQDPKVYFAGDQVNKLDEESGEVKRDTRLDRHGKKPEPRSGFPWWWILLPLILLALIYGLTRNPTPPVDEPSGTTTTYEEPAGQWLAAREDLTA